jgi:hypothetical protein
MNSNQRVVTFALDTKWNDLPETVKGLFWTIWAFLSPAA